MKSTGQKIKLKTRRRWIPLMVILLLAAGGFGYYTWSQKAAATAQAADAGLQTTQVRKGSITISASGSGTLTAGQESRLGFSTTGTVAKLNVQVGDVVKQGDVLAQLANQTQLQAGVNTAQKDLITAQQALATLRQSASANLANAQLALAEAQKAVTDAKSGVVQKGWARCDRQTTDAYYYKYTHAQEQLEALGDGGGNRDYYLNTIVPARDSVAQARAAYEYCAGYSDYEVASSQATLSLAEAKAQQAQETLATLTQNNGLDPIELATAENKVSSAQIALDKARETLEGGTLKAPFDGTILSVAGQAGETAGAEPWITIADLHRPQVAFSVDETDMDKVALGETASVTFDAIPNQTYTGRVVRVNPALETANGYQVIRGLIQLDLTEANRAASLLKGLNGTVTLIQATAKDVLLVPVQAVRDLGDGTYSVFVVGADGQPRMKVVEVGLQDAASAEIRSGLSLGDVVTTGTVQTR